MAPEKKERLNSSEILRYSRQLILPEIGVKGKSFAAILACLIIINKLKVASLITLQTGSIHVYTEY